MATNKVIYGNTTLIDTSEDTAEVGDVKAGETFHSKTGAQMTGTMITSPQNMWYGTCPSYASAENKVVTTSSQDFDFQTGSMLRVSFEDGNTISSPYLVVDSGEPVLIEKLGLHQEVIAIISRTVTSSYWQYFDFDFPALSPGSSLSVTINLNSPYDSQDTYTDTASFIAGQPGNEQMFVYQGSFLDVQYNGITTISISSTYSWSVAFSGNIKSGSGESESLVDYWKPGAVLDFVFDGTNFVLSDGGTNIPKNMWYGTCATSGSTTSKIVNTSTGDFSLKTGNMVRVLFNNATTSVITTLAVDGTAEIYVASVAGSADSSYRWSAGEVVDFVYNGTNYVMSDGGIASTTYYGATKLSSSTSSTSTSLAATPSAVKSAYDLANSKVSDVQVDGISVVSSRTASISTSSSPAANTIAKFDTNAHMNSTDMTSQEIASFVSTVPSGFANLNNLSVVNNIVAGGYIEAKPLAGIIQMFAGSTAPSGWLLCDGDEVAVSDYPDLYDVIGDTYGTPSDSDHFILPDLRGRTPVGSGLGTATDATSHALGQQGGEETHTLTEAQLPAVTGTFTSRAITSSTYLIGSTTGKFSYAATSSAWGRGVAWNSDSTSQKGLNVTYKFGNNENHNNMQPYTVVNYIISTGQPSRSF